MSCSWLAPVVIPDGTPAVLKIGMPHLEGKHEIDGLRFWSGDPTVELLHADDGRGAMLLERCEPGTALRTLPEAEQHRVLAGLLHRIWPRPPLPHRFRHLSAMTMHWSDEIWSQEEHWPDRGLALEGLRLFRALAQPAAGDVLLATDLHAGNVLRAQREEWLVIDPKPFIGDRAYDATQHLFNCRDRLLSDPAGIIQKFADLLCVKDERVRLCLFARAAVEPRDEWRNDWRTELACRIAPT